MPFLWPLGLHHTAMKGLVLISLAEIPYRGFAFFEMWDWNMIPGITVDYSVKELNCETTSATGSQVKELNTPLLVGTLIVGFI